MSGTAIPALSALNRPSASVGGNPALVQAAGGNVSLKRGHCHVAQGLTATHSEICDLRQQRSGPSSIAETLGLEILSWCDGP